MKKICVVSATRAEWYLLKNLCDEIRSDSELKLQLVLTGAHLSAEFGLTWREIHKEFYISKKVSILLASDDKISICKTMSLAVSAFSEVFDELKPDIVVILGDRYEMLAIATAALMMGVPIAHLCGGELTLGALDDSIRHAITKMSHLHFASCEIYKKRILQLGEEKHRVFNSGSLNGEVIKKLKLLSKKELEKALNFPLKGQIYLITYHSETLNAQAAQRQVQLLLKFLNTLDNATLIFTKSNADESGLSINLALQKYCETHSDKARLFDNLGSKLYLSVMKHAAAIIGNSSSGITESPFLKTPCINIGQRQAGRLTSANVINCDIWSLKAAFEVLQSAKFKANLAHFKNPFQAKNASRFIKETLKNADLELILQKKFVDG